MVRHSKNKQPVRLPTGGRQGQRQQLETAQQAVPLPDRRSGPPGPGGGETVQPVDRPDVFGASARPGEPLTAGAAEGPGSNQLGLLPEDTVSFLRAVYTTFPSQGLRRLIEYAGEQQ